MRARFFLLLLVSTSLGLIGQPRAWACRVWVPPTKVGVCVPPTKVGFDLYHDYLIVLRGSAGPVKGLNFLLDTGSTPSVLDSRVAAKLHLQVVPEQVAVLSGNVTAGHASVPSLEVGPMRKDNLPVLVQDLSFLRKALPFQIDGIVGLDVLGQSSFVIDYAAREVRFGTAPSLPVSIPLQMKEGLAIVDATVNHSTVHLLLDTGASSLIMFDAMPAQATPQPTARTIAEFERKQVRLNSFSLGEKDFGRQSAFMVHNTSDAGHAFDGLMSPSALGITMVAVDLGRGTLAFARER